MNLWKRKLKKKLNIRSIKHLAYLLGVKLQTLKELLLSGPNFEYRKFKIKKKSNGFRQIYIAPNHLKSLQKKVLKLLAPIEQSSCAYGSVKSHSRYDCLQPHLLSKYVYEGDVKNFFPSVAPKRVYNLFVEKLGCAPNIARILVFLSTTDFGLPQGVNQSPVLANLILKDFDTALEKVCQKNNVKYTRYVDNLVLSSNQKIRFIKEFISRGLSKYGLRLKKGELNLVSETNNKVLGFQIKNHRLTIPNNERKNLRSEVYQFIKSPTSDVAKRESIEGKIRELELLYEGEAKGLRRVMKTK